MATNQRVTSSLRALLKVSNLKGTLNESTLKFPLKQRVWEAWVSFTDVDEWLPHWLLFINDIQPVTGCWGCVRLISITFIHLWDCGATPPSPVTSVNLFQLTSIDWESATSRVLNLLQQSKLTFFFCLNWSTLKTQRVEQYWFNRNIVIYVSKPCPLCCGQGFSVSCSLHSATFY